MKKNYCLTFLSGAICLLIRDAEAHSHTTYIVEQPARTVVLVEPHAPMNSYVEVESAPPEDFDEEMSPNPGYGYVWIKGHWRWNGNEWIRAHGHWDMRPHDQAVWVPGYWQRHHNHWRWREGYWH